MLVIAAQLRGLKSAADIAGNERRLNCRECSRFCKGVSNPEQVPTGIEMAIAQRCRRLSPRRRHPLRPYNYRGARDELIAFADKVEASIVQLH